MLITYHERMNYTNIAYSIANDILYMIYRE